MKDLIGVSIGRYEIQAKIGEGGMALVYRAYDTRLKRDVAIKVIHANNAQQERFFKRFERETRAMAVLTHPGIVQIYDVGDYDGLPYLVMEYLPGGTLKRYLGRPLAWQEAVSMLLPVSDALAFAHKQGIIHRDVKPSNILLDGMGRTRLSDFGIAKFLDQKETMELTGTNLGVGTPEYMAPEQGLGQDLDERADIYALASVCFELVTGQKPFQGSEALAILVRKINEPPPHAADFLHGLPDQLDQALYRAMASKPDARFASMGAFSASLSRVLGKGDGAAAVEAPDTEMEEQATRDFDLMSPESLELALGEYQTRLAEMEASVPALQEQVQAAVAAKDWGKVQEISEQIKVCENSQATYQETIARLGLISDLRKQGDYALNTGEWEGLDTIILRLEELGRTGERYAQILKKGLVQARKEKIEQVSQQVTIHIEKQDWTAVHEKLAQLCAMGTQADDAYAELKARYEDARRVVEQKRNEIQRLTKLAQDSLNKGDWASAEAATIALNRLGAEGQKAAQPLSESLSMKRQESEARDEHARHLATQVEAAMSSEDWMQAESALAELRRMDAGAWAARVETLAGELDARKISAARREQKKVEAALAEQQKKEIQRLAGLIQDAIENENWQEAETGLASLEGLGKDGQRETAILAEQLAKARREAKARERRAAEAAAKAATKAPEIQEEQIKPVVEAALALSLPEIIRKPEAAGNQAAQQEMAAVQAQKREKKPFSLIKTLLPVSLGLLAIAAAVVLLGNRGSLPAAAMEETPAAVVMDTHTATATQAPTHTEIPMLTVTFTAVPTETPIPSPTPITKISEKDGMEMVLVPAGEFIMGSDDGQDYWQEDEKPSHIVFLDAFWIDKYEVTNVQYSKCVDAGKCTTPPETKYFVDVSYSDPIFANYPVNVSWNDALKYCAWVERRLPSEAEWEKAARGTDGRTYPWGEEIPNDSLLNFAENEYWTTSVGSYIDGASPYDVMDMAGNVFEWTGSIYKDYPYDANDGRENLNSAELWWVIRGGSWSDEDVNSTSRSGWNRNYRGSNSGFRCAVSASSSELSLYSADREITTPIPTPTPTFTLTPESPIGSTRISEVDGMEMVYVPAGEFIMGSDEGNPDEQPAHIVYLDGFWIDKYEVNNNQFQSCVIAGSCQPPIAPDYFEMEDNHPVVYVSWDDAKSYCLWAGKRLPSEAEWEKAARGTTGFIYPWGDSSPEQSLANFENNEGDVTAVGSYLKGVSPFGAMDMAGNVWEWVADWYGSDYYLSQSRWVNPLGPEAGEYTILKGGAWDYKNTYMRSFERLPQKRRVWSPSFGFRCAVSAEEN